jgi:hypothetical protein
MIEAMRRDRGLQRRAQTAMIAASDAWCNRPDVAPLLGDLRRYGQGTPLERCEALSAVLAPGETATRFAAEFVRQFTSELAGNRLGQMPFRHGFDGAVSTLLLARSERAQLILHAREPGEWEPDTASFSHADRHEAVIAGHAEGRIVQRDPASGQLHLEPLILKPGLHVALDLAHQALQVTRVHRRVVTLRLHRFAEMPGPSRDYRLADSVLLNQSSGDIRASRLEMMLTLLGRMQCTVAAPLMAAMAGERGDTSLRWQALRECLALDTAAGFRALCAVAREAADPLAEPAAALRAQLMEAHPQLRSLERAECPE